MITRFTEQRGRPPQTLAADTTYGNGELLHWLEERGVTPQIPVLGEVRQDGRTVEQALVDALILEALQGRSKLAAIQSIFDRLEGKPKPQLDFKDISDELRGPVMRS